MHLPRTGFSLLEVMVASAILVTLLSMAGNSLDMGVRLQDRIALQSDLNNKANTVLNKLALDLRNAKGGATLVVPTDSAQLGMNPVTFTYTVPSGTV
jgi:prepilin-type N-terminal cleavage/methylation domain-containing protein